MREVCKSCPWKNSNPHSLKFRQYVDKMESIGISKAHQCHSNSKDIWSLKNKISENNICIGRIKMSKGG
jgi:hypothetical protein